MQLRAVPAGAAPPRGPRRRIAPILVGALAVAALGTGVAMALLPGSDEPATALPDAKPSVPVASAPGASTPAPPSPSPSRSPSPSASASASRSPSPSPSPSASRTSAPPSPSPSPTPSRSVSPPPPPAQAPTLKYGDSGPEVEKLQRLLAAKRLYRGRIDGKYGDRVEEAVSTFQWDNNIDKDPWGVYGPATRAALEG
ncbi:peptidoglycan-binding protein [Streptomyces sp. NPDC060028]|uniref:peptidoglycan-binding domain-containing protein n=1 Tax=Streptomyces sp. NPDC060028 TaxID=3347041 RepID=UPI00368561E7